MSVHISLTEKLAILKTEVEGDFKDLVVYLEAAYQHNQASLVEAIVKDAVADALLLAAIKVGNITNNLPKPVEDSEVTPVVEKPATATRRKQSTN